VQVPSTNPINPPDPVNQVDAGAFAPMATGSAMLTMVPLSWSEQMPSEVVPVQQEI